MKSWTKWTRRWTLSRGVLLRRRARRRAVALAELEREGARLVGGHRLARSRREHRALLADDLQGQSRQLVRIAKSLVDLHHPQDEQVGTVLRVFRLRLG